MEGSRQWRQSAKRKAVPNWNSNKAIPATPSTLSPFCNIIMMAPWLFYCSANCNGRLISSFVASQDPGPGPYTWPSIPRVLGRVAFVFFPTCISYAFRLILVLVSVPGGLTMKEESCTVLTLYYPRQKKLTTCHSLPSLPTVLHSLGIEQLAT